MSDVSFTVAAPYAPAGSETRPPTQTRGAPLDASQRVSEENAADRISTEIPRQSKVKTDMRTAHSFTYTFFDAKTLEVIGQWPQKPTYQLPNPADPVRENLSIVA